MLVEHRGHRPEVDATAYVAPTAVLCGNVRVGPGARVLFGAVLTAEDGEVDIGACSVVMENALVRGRAGHPATVGDNVLIGPHAHINGAGIGDGCFVATGCSIFPGARLGADVEVRINAVVHVNSRLSEGALVPIGWVAVGDPARVLPPDRHEDIWAVQQTLNFEQTVYGVAGDASAAERMARQSAWYGEHRNDTRL